MKFLCTKFKKDRYDLITQVELAEKVGVSSEVIKNIESGKKKVKYGDELFESICVVLGLSSEDYWTRATKVLTLFNHKGGVGKSSCLCNIASVLVSEFDKRVLIIDCDAQANTTQNFNMTMINDYNARNLYNSFINQKSIGEYIVNTGYEGLDMIVGHTDVSLIEPILPMLPDKSKRFENIIKDVRDSGEYDFILCDTSPALSMWNNIIIRNSDAVIIPFEPEPLSLGGIGNALGYIEQINKDLKKDNDATVDILGIVINKCDMRQNVTKAITEVVEKLYKDQLFETKLPLDVAVKKSQSERLPISINHSRTKVYEALTNLAKEIIDGTESI